MAFEEAIIKNAENLLKQHTLADGKSQTFIVKGDNAAKIAIAAKDLIVQAVSTSIVLRHEDGFSSFTVPTTVLKEARKQLGVIEQGPEKPAKNPDGLKKKKPKLRRDSDDDHGIETYR